jgi:hypothetical protein
MDYSTTQQRIAAIGHQPVLKKSAFVAALAIFGVFNVLAGIISLASAIIFSADASAPGLANPLLIDAVYEFSLGALIFASSRALAQGKILSLWLYGGSMIADCLYNLMMGNPLNYVFIGFGLFLIWQILQFRNRLELS